MNDITGIILDVNIGLQQVQNTQASAKGVLSKEDQLVCRQKIEELAKTVDQALAVPENQKEVRLLHLKAKLQKQMSSLGDSATNIAHQKLSPRDEDNKQMAQSSSHSQGKKAIFQPNFQEVVKEVQSIANKNHEALLSGELEELQSKLERGIVFLKTQGPNGKKSLDSAIETLVNIDRILLERLTTTIQAGMDGHLEGYRNYLSGKLNQPKGTKDHREAFKAHIIEAAGRELAKLSAFQKRIEEHRPLVSKTLDEYAEESKPEKVLRSISRDLETAQDKLKKISLNDQFGRIERQVDPSLGNTSG